MSMVHKLKIWLILYSVPLYIVFGGRCYAEDRIVEESYLAHSNDVTSVVFGVETDRYYSSSTDGTVAMWSIGSGTPVKRITCSGEVQAMCLADGNSCWVALGMDGLECWDLCGGQRIGTFRLREQEETRFVCNAPGGMVVTADFRARAGVWDVSKQSETIRFRTVGREFDAGIVGIAVASTRRLAVCCVSDNTIEVYDLTDGEMLRRLGKHASSISGSFTSAVAISRDESCLAEGNSDGIDIWEMDAWKLSGSIKLGSSPRGLAFSPNGKALAVVGFKGLQICDVKRQVASACLGQPKAQVVAFSPDGARVVTGGKGGRVNVVRVDQ